MANFFRYLQVTDHDKELLKVTLDVVKEDCRKPRRKYRCGQVSGELWAGADMSMTISPPAAGLGTLPALTLELEAELLV